MKIKESDLTNAQLMVIEPDIFQANAEIPSISSVNDMEISGDESYIIYTGVNTEDKLIGYHHTIVGKIDMDLNPLWGNTYEIAKNRYSGIDIEFGKHETSLFVLMNSETTPMAIMELDPDGKVLQQPVQYDFSDPSGAAPNLGAARGHKMHYTLTEGLIVTGNCFIRQGENDYQELFKYEVARATDLINGNFTYGVFVKELVPRGNQVAVTSWWAPENSLLKDDKLSIIGVYNNFIEHGYIYINESGYDKTNHDCYYEGIVKQIQLTSTFVGIVQNATEAQATEISINPLDPWSPIPLSSCMSSLNKSGFIDEINEQIKLNWQFRGIDETGIYLFFNSTDETVYTINVYDVTGRIVQSKPVNVKGEKFVYLKFNTTNQLYMINVRNGFKSETIKVAGFR